MTDLEPILSLWQELYAARADYVLATIVAVEGSSYRKPGAFMLIAQDGRRSGTVSGGCLEAEVAQRAWWLTASGPVVERYSTVADDGELPYGSGCGGVVYILLERSLTANPLLASLQAAFSARASLAVATVLEGAHTCRRAMAGGTGIASRFPEDNELQNLAQTAFEQRRSLRRSVRVDGNDVQVQADYHQARPGLWIFGAGDDARPLATLARELGWFVAVADGRSHLATPARFPMADRVRALPIAELPAATSHHLPLLGTDAAMVMTHSFEQDSHILASLLLLAAPLPYIGVLGPQRRTRDLLAEASRLLNLPDRGERWPAQLHAPAGLDLGGETPAEVALSILSEMQQALHHATAQPLQQVRAAPPVAAG
ncbi:MAG TPA: XdhC family protein [Terracidiphilus sp.]|nr:XdhC family protein [Terracidiphilus sp.]